MWHQDIPARKMIETLKQFQGQEKEPRGSCAALRSTNTAGQPPQQHLANQDQDSLIFCSLIGLIYLWKTFQPSQDPQSCFAIAKQLFLFLRARDWSVQIKHFSVVVLKFPSYWC
jgi:hypothetical protein